jgi:hypothetical protein
MKNHKLYLFIIIIACILVYQVAVINPVIASQLPANADNLVHYQVTQTEMPLSSIDDEGLTTDPILLQIIILLGIVAVLVIFIGVWINRRKVDLQ